MLLGDIGETALLAARRELDRAELTLFRPIKVMLASPERTAEAIWGRFAKSHLTNWLSRAKPRARGGASAESLSTGRP
jgi:DNA ligase-1